MVSSSNKSAGVYNKITDLSQRIGNVTTSIAAFVGMAERGDVMKPVPFFDTEDRRQKFGDLNPEKYGMSGYSANTFIKAANRAFYVRVVNQAKTAVAYFTVDDPDATNPVIRLANNSEIGSTQPVGVEDPMNTLGFLATTPGIENVMGFFCAKDPGIWNNKITIAVYPANPKGVPIRGNGHDPLKFYVDVFEGTYIVGMQPQEHHLVSRSYGVDENGDQTFIEDVINEQSTRIRFKNNSLCKTFDIVKSANVTLGGGTAGLPVTNAQLMEGWNLYRDSERIDIGILVNAGQTSFEIHHYLAELARDRGDAFAVLDMPSNYQDVADAVNYRRNTLNLNSYYAGLYTPRVLEYDEYTDRQIWVPISGYVAACIATMDARYNVWWAPAGIENGRLDVLGVEVAYNKQGARDALDEAQINYVRKLPQNLGYCIWNQSTLYAVTSNLQYINVVRLTMTVLKASNKFTTDKLFDPNDSFLRAEIKGAADEYMEDIKKGRGVYAYSNVCDERNNTNESIANRDLILDMLFEPTIFTKRVHLRFALNPKGSTVTDLV